MKRFLTTKSMVVVAFLIALLIGCSDVIDGDKRNTDDIPQDFLAQSGLDSGEVALEWTQVEDIDGYMILRATTPTGEYDTIAPYVEDLFFLDVVPADGTQYYYKVLAVYSDGTTSDPSDVASAIGYIKPITDTTVVVDTTDVVEYDTIVDVDTAIASDTVITTETFEISTDMLIVTTDSLDKGVVFNSVFDTLEITVDTTSVHIYRDTLGIDKDTVVVYDTTTSNQNDTIAVSDSTVEANLDTMVVTTTTVVNEQIDIYKTDTLINDVLYKVVYDTLIFVDTVSVSVDTTILQKSNVVEFPSVIMFAASGGNDDDAYLGASLVTEADVAVGSSINLLWTDCGAGFTYDVYVKRPDSLYYTFSDSVLLASDLTTNSFEDTESSPSYQQYTLVIKHSDLPDSAKVQMGHRSVSNLEFFNEYNKTVLKSQSRLTYMHEKKTGVETVYSDSIGHANPVSEVGSLHYDGPFLTVNMDYTFYRDFHITLNDRMTTEVGNIFSLDGTTTGTINVTGLYEGVVELHVTVDRGDPAGGYYTVTQKIDGVEQTPEDIQFSTVSGPILNNPYLP